MQWLYSSKIFLLFFHEFFFGHISSISHNTTNITDGLWHYILQRIAGRHFNFNRTFNHKSTWTNTPDTCPDIFFLILFLYRILSQSDHSNFNGVCFFFKFVSVDRSLYYLKTELNQRDSHRCSKMFVSMILQRFTWMALI